MMSPVRTKHASDLLRDGNSRGVSLLKFWLTCDLFVLLIVTMDDNYSYMDESDSNFCRPRYFQPQDTPSQKELHEKLTSECSPAQDVFFTQDQGTFEQQVEPPETWRTQMMKQMRAKILIQTAKSQRDQYLKSQAGRFQKTNSLAINICTLLRCRFRQYKTFEQSTPSQIQSILKFNQQRCNFNSLSKLLGMNDPQEKDNPDKQQYKMGKKVKRLNMFLAKKLQQVETLKAIMQSKKMKMQNKLILLRHIEQIRKGIIDPTSLKGWRKRDV